MALFLKILADIAKQQKFIEAGPAASWLWLAGLGHCRLSSTDGFIHAAVVPTLVPGLKQPLKHAETLVAARLWRKVESGFDVNDYLDWNPSKAELDTLRKEDAERKRAVRRKDTAPMSGWTPSGFQPDAPRVRADTTRAGASSPSPSPSGGLDLSELPEESARNAVPPVWRPAGPRRAGPSERDIDYHRRHCPAWAQAACDAGICVPKYLWPQWERRQPTEALKPFIGAWATQAKGDKAETFWPAAFEAHFGAAVAKTSRGDKTTRALDALDEALLLNEAHRKAVGDGRA